MMTDTAKRDTGRERGMSRINEAPDPSRPGGQARRRRRLAYERFVIVLLILFVSLSASGAAVPEDQEDQPEEMPPPSSILRRDGFAPTISLHGFGDVTLMGEQIETEGVGTTGTSGFAVGELDLYIVSRLTNNFSFLTEIVFEQEADGRAILDVERFWIKYTLSDRFWASLGRHHTPLGYWNRTYHHGLLLQPTVHRPEALKFEDEVRGGFLPIHQVGLTSGGSGFADTWRLDYAGGIYNGRGLTRKDIQGTGDLNDEKALGLNLNFTRETDRRILFGPTFFYDDIPPDPAVPGREGVIDEKIYGAQFAYRDEHLEILSEYYQVDHYDQATAGDYDHSAYFVIGIWNPWRWKPYAGLDRMNIDPGDPYFIGLTDLKRYLVGVRFDANPFVAVKFEYRHDKRPGEEIDALDIQVAFTF